MILNSLKSRITAAIIGIVLVSLSITILFFRQEMTEELSVTLEENIWNLLHATINNVETQYRSILYHKEKTFSRRKRELKDHISIAFAIIDSAYNAFKEGQLSEQQAKQRVIEEFRGLRYNDGIGYFWINDTERPYPRMIMHATIPSLNGRILDEPSFNCALGRHENLFKAFVDVSLAHGEGFVDYFWPKPIANGLTENQPKISFVRLFKPWNWVIGTGIYIDDIETDVQDRLEKVISGLNDTLAGQRIGENGYLAIIDESNRILVHPYLAGRDGSQLINRTTGGLLLDEIRHAAFTERKTLDYLWDKPGARGQYIFPRRAYVAYYKPLGWYIHATVFREDLEDRVTKLSQTLLVVSCVLLLLAILLSLWVSRSIANPLILLIRSINQTDSDGIPLKRTTTKGTTEIISLSRTINRMVDTISASRNDLKAQRDLSQSIINGSPYIILGVDPEGTVIFLNAAGEQTSGYQKEEIIGRKWWELPFSEMSEKKQKDLFVKWSKEGDVRDFELTLIRKSGERRYILWSSYTRKDEQTAAREIYWFGNDVTERKQAEESRLYLRNYLLSIINSMPSILVGIDVNGVVTQWNTAARRYTGVSTDKALGRPLNHVYPDLFVEMEKVRQSMLQREIMNGIRHIVRHNGNITYQEVTIYPLLEGDEAGAVIRVDDVTERVRMEEVMIQSEKMLSVGGLAAGMAHEINNPLAAMIQTANIMSSRLIEDVDLAVNRKAAEKTGIDLKALTAFMEIRGIPRMIANINEAGQRIATIVNNMLNFARKSKDNVSSQNMVELVDKTLVLAETDYDLKKQYDFKQINIIKAYEPDLPLIPCEGAKIQQVLLNIFSNGAQAMYEAETEIPRFVVRMGVDENDKMLQLEIEDNGPGIDEALRNRIFEPFFTTKPVGIGTGLGLSVSYFIIKENHGGELLVDSRSGAGATFIIRLPLQGRKTEN